MDLDLNFPGSPGIAGHATGRMCCDPALGFAEQSVLKAKANSGVGNLVETLPAVGAESRNAFRLVSPFGLPEDEAFDIAARASDMAGGDRDQFLEGCLKIQEDERLRLGRELHDSTGQLLLALRLNVAQLKRVHGTPVEDMLLDEIEDMASQIDREIRSFSFLHYPAEIERQDLGESLHFLTRGFAARTGLKISFNSLCDRAVRSSPAALALLRVAQEALMNVHRHACALHVRVSLTLRDKLLQLSIRDDGVGIPPEGEIAESHGIGLLGMRHRVERLGGSFAIKRMKHGTKLVASVPVS
jgi:signal transduction histidine kinase